jgi:hypothetical protein
MANSGVARRSADLGALGAGECAALGREVTHGASRCGGRFHLERNARRAQQIGLRAPRGRAVGGAPMSVGVSRHAMRHYVSLLGVLLA